MDEQPEAARAADELPDPDGELARRRWAHLPAPIEPGQWVVTQPVEREPTPETDHELARTFLLWGAG